MKLLYIAPILINIDKQDGVIKKVLNHYDIFKKYFNVSLVSYGVEGVLRINNNKVTTTMYGKSHRRFELYSFITKLIKTEKFDCVYIRYPKSEPQFLKLIKTLKKTGCRIVMEIPTYPYNGEMFTSVKGFTIAAVDGIYQKRLKKYIDRVVTYSDDEFIFGIKTIRTINGIVFDKISPRKVQNKDNEISLIAVAMIWNCHGYDRIIEGLNHYYSNGGKQKIVFHIVGTGPAVPGYKLLIDKYNLSDHVILEGYRTGSELDMLYDNSDIAINSIAIHRLKLEKESTLKTKEYAAKGLPIISSYIVDAFDEYGSRKFVLRVPNDDTPVDINKVIEFYNKLYLEESEENLSVTIREVSKKICDMEKTLQPIINFFEFNKKV